MPGDRGGTNDLAAATLLDHLAGCGQAGLEFGKQIVDFLRTVFTPRGVVVQACQAQVLALGSGEKLVTPGADVVKTTNERYKPGQRRKIGELEWAGLLRLMERRYPGFRD